MSIKRTTLIKNDDIKALLEEKGGIVEEGKKLSVEIEEKATPIITKYLADKGIVEDGDSEDGFGDGTHKYKNYKGTYVKMAMAFKDYSLQALQKQIETELGDENEQLKAKELQVNEINAKVCDKINEVLPELNLGEFEEVIKVDLKGIDIEFTIVDRVEEFKSRLLEAKKK